MENLQGTKILVGIIMGSKTDLPVMKKAASILDELGIPYEISIKSAHRTPDEMFRYAEDAKNRGIEVIIAGAGGAAHLPGMTASKTSLPVIGVPIPTKTLQGIDSLLSIVQMPSGTPVATVAIGNAENASFLAARILGIKYQEIQGRLEAYARNLKEKVINTKISNKEVL
jgi:5-(carboxyamino)imidazole ribonucleotide mutase